MQLITDNIEWADNYLDSNLDWSEFNIDDNSNIVPIIKKIFPVEAKLYSSKKTWGQSSIQSSLSQTNYNTIDSVWQYLFLIEYAPESQYDALINLSHGKEKIPNGILCLAGSGKKFHGFRNRSWISRHGNIHLSAYLKPEQYIRNFGIGFLILSAISVIMAIDEFAELRQKASVKWVNDILIEKAKICGVLAHTQAQGKKVSDAIIGIGVNVESKPDVEANTFVPLSACINDYLDEEITQGIFLNELLKHLTINYQHLLSGNYIDLLNFYRSRSNIIGKQVSIWSDGRDGSIQKINSGIIERIGDNLELFFENSDKAITNGRLVIEE